MTAKLTGKKVKIGPILYDYLEVKGLFNDTTKLNGHIIFQNATIQLEQEMSSQAKQVTLWHEILHGILINAGFSDHDEKTIEILAYGIMGVLIDNPWLRDEPVQD